MHLKRITLTNVRQFATKTFDFLPGFNLLVGENGAGKTTLLRSIAAVLGPTGGRYEVPILIDDDISLHSRDLRIDADVSHSPNVNAGYSYQRQWGARARRQRQADFPLLLLYGSNESTCTSFVEQRKRQQSPQRRELRRFRDEEWLYEEMERRPTTEKGTTRFGNSREIRHFVSRVLSVFSPKFVHFSWVFEPYRCTIRQQEPGPGDLEPRYKRLLANAILRYLDERKRPLRTVEQSRLIIDSSGYPIGDKQEYRRADPIPPFKEILQRFGDSDVPSANFENLVAEIHLTPRILLDTPAGPFLLSQMSDGEKRLFSLFVDIARQLYLANGGREIRECSAVVLIDEIDVHLHPKWQRQIVPSLEDLFPACQFIATTHSPFAIQAVDRQKIGRLGESKPVQLEDEGNSIEDIAEEIQGVPMPQRSQRAELLSKTAEHYFRLLRQRNAAPAELEEAEEAFRVASEPFSSQPAVNALLRVEKLEGKKQ